MKKLFILGLSVLSMVLLAGCSDTTPEVNEVLEVLNSIEISSQVSEDFTLTVAKNNVIIEWTSNNEAIVVDGANASVTRADEDVKVVLTAKASKDDLKEEKVFNVTVIKSTLTDEDIVNEVANSLELASTTEVDLTLPTTGQNNTTITWATNNQTAITSTGVVTRADVDVEVTLTATVSLNSATKSKEFKVTVLKNDVEEIIMDELFISEYYKGASNNKYIEIYNPNDFAVDLSTYKLVQANNSSTFDTVASSYKLELEGSLAAYSTFVICNNSSVDALKETVEANASLSLFSTSNMISFTGDDAIGLFKNDTLVDIFGIDDGKRNNFEINGVSGTMVAIRNVGSTATTTWDSTEWKSNVPTTDNLLLDNVGIHLFEYESKAQEVALSLNVDYIQNDNFVLDINVLGTTITWTSSDSAIVINGANATVTRKDGNVVVVLTALVTDEENKTYTIEFDVLVEGNAITSIEGALQETAGSKVQLTNVTVFAKGSSGVFITDGVSSIYCYGNANMEVGKVYNVTGVTGVYNNIKQITNSAEFTLVEDGVVSSINPTTSTVEALTNVELNNGYYTINATINVSGSTVTLVSGDFSVTVNNSVSTSLEVLKSLHGATLDIDVLLINTNNTSGTTRYVVFAGDSNDLNVTDEIKVELAKNDLNVNSTVLSDIDLPTSGLFETSIVWTSNNEAVISTEGVVVRPTDADVTVILTATVSSNGVSDVISFEVVVKVLSEDGSADVQSITFDFSSLSGSADLSSSKLSAIFEGSNFSVSNMSKLYEGSGNGIRFGTSSVVGSLTIINSLNLNISKVEVVGHQWANDTDSELNINGVSQLLSQTSDLYTYDINTSNDLVLSSAVKRIYVTSITIYFVV